jgi:hypothetical protein
VKTREYKTTIPYTPDQLDMLRWHTRESFQWKIEADGLELVEYTETDVDASTIPPKTREWARDQFGDEPLWREFTALAKLPDELEALTQ